MTDLALMSGAPCTVDPDSLDARPLALPLPCGAPSVAYLTFGCPHEHVSAALACAGCLADLQQIADVLICPECADHPGQPHGCPQQMQVEPLPGEPGPFRPLAADPAPDPRAPGVPGADTTTTEEPDVRP